jgi:hypothetical protein
MTVAHIVGVNPFAPEKYVVGFSATREVTDQVRAQIETAVAALPPGAVVVQGACRGGDALIARLAFQRGDLHVHAVVPGIRTQLDPSWKSSCHSYELMPPGTTYRHRNTRIVELVNERLIAIPGVPEGVRASGTWMTINIARRAGKPVEVR